MRRGFSVTLVLVLVSLPGSAIPLHLHAYGDHAHPEHHHGVAVHQHAQTHRDHAVRSGEAPARASGEMSPCEPSAHVVSIVSCAESVSTLEMAVAHLAITAANHRPSSSRERLAIIDMRGHGPPGTTPAAPRAPPALNHS